MVNEMYTRPLHRLLALALALVLVLSLFPAGALTAWAAGPYTVSLSVQGSGTVRLNGSPLADGDSISAEENETLTLEAQPDTGYEIAAVRINGTEQTISDPSAYSGSFVVSADTALELEFTLATPTRTVTVTKTGLGVVKLNGTETDSLSVSDGETVSVEASPAAKYALSALQIGGEAQTISDPGHFTGSFQVNGADVEIQADFVKTVAEFTVSASKSGEGSVKLNGLEADSIQVDEGDPLSIQAIPAAGWEISAYVLDGVSGTPSEGEKAFLERNIAAVDHAVSFQVSFVRKSFTVSLSPTANASVMFRHNGSLVSGSSFTVLYGDKVEAIVSPASGYAVTGIQINGGEASNYGGVISAQGSSTVCTVVSVGDNLVFKPSVTQINDNWSQVDFTKGYLNPVYSENAPGQRSKLVYVYPNTVSQVQFSLKSGEYPMHIGENFVLNGSSTDTLTQSTKLNRLHIDVWYLFPIPLPVDVQLPADDVYFILDKTAPEIELAEDQEGACCKSDLSVPITVRDPDWLKQSDAEGKELDSHTYSGVKELSYQIEISDDESFSAPTPDDSGVLLSHDALSAVKEDTVSLDLVAGNYDGKYVRVTLTAKDRAGNESSKSFTVSFNTAQPELSISFDSASYVMYNGGYYFDQGRSATVTVVDKKNSFDKDGLSFDCLASLRDGSEVEKPIQLITDWTHVDSEDGKGTRVYTAKVSFKDAAYVLSSLSYTNKADNSVSRSMSSAPQMERAFTVDRQSPSGSVTVTGLDQWTKTWSEVLHTLSFGLFGSEEHPVRIDAEPADEVSPIAAVHLYLSPETDPLDEAALEALAEDQWQSFFPEDGLELTTDRRFVAYLRIVDAAGHKAYISSDGVIVDNLEAVIDLTPDAPNVNGLYGQAGGDKIGVDIHVKDDDSLSAPSGIKSVEYWVISAGTETARASLFNFDRESPAYGELVFEQNFPVEIPKADNNACDTAVYVKVVDNAGNERITEPALNLDIDVTAPKLELKLEHSDNPGSDDGFYNQVSAVLEITERSHHFDPEAAKAGLSISAVDAKGDPILSGWTLGDWELVEGEKPDEAIHRLPISFEADGNYSLSAAYTDLAGNAGNNVSANFTLDCTPPTGSVTVGGKGTWTKLLETLSFGLWSKENLDVSAAAEDATSAVEAVDYYLFQGDLALTKPDLEALAASEWKPFDLIGGLSLEPDRQITVYLRLRDKAGNTAYLSSDGLVVETKLDQGNIVLTPEAPNANGIYGASTEPVKVNLHVSDDEPYSGIRSVEYWITRDGSETARSTIYSYEYIRDPGDDANGGSLEIYEYGILTDSKTGVTPAKLELTRQWDGQIFVDRAVNNSCNVELHVKLTDNAGNQAEQLVKLDIDNTAPAVSVAYDNNSPHKVVEDRGYYPAERTATITIVERDHHFSAEAATNGIVITAVDARGETVLDAAACKALIQGWTLYKGGTPDEDRHVATIRYQADANYSFQISFRDLADNQATVGTGLSATPYAFTVDQTQPQGSIEAVGLNTWDQLIETLSFGLFSRVKVDFQGSWDDATSPIDTVSYYKTDSNSALDRAALDAVSTWQPFSGLSVSPNERATVYLRVVDYAGNVRYVSTDGIIVDDTAPRAETIAPRVTVSPAQPVNGIYNSDVPVRVVVEDPIGDPGGTKSYSGLKEIRYEVLNMGSVTQSGVLFSYSGTAHSQSELRQLWQSDSAFTVDKDLNNSNEVQLRVYAVDNAGNEGSGSAEMKIDVTAPAISVSYDNNNGDTSFADAVTAAYFDAGRTATIIITERNFDPAQVKLSLTNTDGALPVLSAWRTEGGSGNGDDTRHIATLSYTADGDYSFDIACTDQAGNQNGAVTYNGLAPQRFTIDRTAPLIQVDYRPGDTMAKNGNYFNQPRTATITITEHNFETSRIQIELLATDHGQTIAAPAVSQWASSGNTHTATIVYEADGDYRFDISYRDKAGNPAADYEADSFVVDQTPPTVVLEGVDNASANSGKGSIGFTLRVTDTNFDGFIPVITGSFYEDGQFVTRELSLGELRNVADGQELVVENLPDDGIYTVSCTAVDKAGNAFTELTLYNADGAYTVPASDGAPLVSFSVNRKGSAYAVDEGTAALLEHYYVQRVREDLVLIEVNANRVSQQTLTLNGRTLTEGSDYRLSTEEGEGQWFRYSYTVSKELFAAEGEYNLVVSSKDEANNDTYSDVKGAEVKLVVDATAPVVTISGLETDGRYQTDRQLVTLIPTDDGGALRSLQVLLVDEAGETIRTLIDLEGEDFEKALEEGEGKITFTLEEGLFQNVRIICDDWADYGPDENILYDETFTDVSVSSNALKIFWANKPLRWGSMGGAGGIGIAAILLALLKKKKKKVEVQ